MCHESRGIEERREEGSSARTRTERRLRRLLSSTRVLTPPPAVPPFRETYPRRALVTPSEPVAAPPDREERVRAERGREGEERDAQARDRGLAKTVHARRRW